MERARSPRDLQNWRFQQALYRAYYDAYQRAAPAARAAAQHRARRGARRRAAGVGRRTRQAMAEAERILAASAEPVAPQTAARVRSSWPRRCSRASGCSSSVPATARSPSAAARTSTRVDARSTTGSGCGAQFAEIRAPADERSGSPRSTHRRAGPIPGPGGFYDDLGNPRAQPHLVRGLPSRKIPGRFSSGGPGFGYRPGWRLSWMTHAESFYDGLSHALRRPRSHRPLQGARRLRRRHLQPSVRSG